MTGENDPKQRHEDIDTFLDWFQGWWHEHPYLRLGQIMSNVAKELANQGRQFYDRAPLPGDPFNVEDVMIPYALGRLDARVAEQQAHGMEEEG